MIHERFNYWKELTTLCNEDKEKLQHMSGEELADSFYQELAFGTAGLRGKIGPGTNRMNEQVIARATRGLAGVIEKRGQKAMDRGVAIAWDVRERSERFMEVAAAMLASCGIQVHIYKGIRPTPMLSFAVRELKTQAGIVVTASHNPKEYNGYKVYWKEGSQIQDAMADEISREIAKYGYDVWPEKSFEAYKEEGLIHVIDDDVEEKYYALTLDKAVEDDVKKDISIVYTPLNGTGNLPVRRILKERGFHNIHLVEEQTEPDSTFASVGYPNPEDFHAFEKALDLGKEVDADLLIATDPDCDRVAIVAKDEAGEYIPFTGNQTGALLLEYILSRRSSKGDLPTNSAVVKSIVTGDIGRRICEHYGVAMFNALTGFKNICAPANRWDDTKEYEFLFGYEESIGYVYGDHVRDKDAVVTSMIAAEMAAYYLSIGKRLPEVLEDIFRKYDYQGEKLLSVVKEGQEGQAQIQAIMEDLRKNPIRSIESLTVEKEVDYAEGVEGIGTSNVLEYHLNDGSRFFVRPSGTEPKIKLYIYSSDKDKDKAKEKIDWIEAEVIRRFNA
ncbi:phospho-sugar mutase [Aedoeadaptatus pacaensis]|uniref:phospho-sugar mutase n=1 Tax=Aedoeadaptatus pacaensis TaxID=1776390 RepID=UPI000A6040AC|nr:phospho-sugar mutase [Peptoniphilus pacaensis]